MRGFTGHMCRALRWHLCKKKNDGLFLLTMTFIGCNDHAAVRFTVAEYKKYGRHFLLSVVFLFWLLVIPQTKREKSNTLCLKKHRLMWAKRQKTPWAL